jgi:hypothetical protein
MHRKYRIGFCWGPPRKRTVTAGQERERWVKESEEGKGLEALVGYQCFQSPIFLTLQARLNNMSATWRMIMPREAEDNLL